MNDTKNKQINIEKLDFDRIEKEQIPYVLVCTNVIQNIKDAKAGFIWVFLQSLPPTWTVNKNHLMKHFNLSERSYQRYMSYLSRAKLVQYIKGRSNTGTFGQTSLLVLNGTAFDSTIEFNHTAKNGIVEPHRQNTTPPKSTAVVFGDNINTTLSTKEMNDLKNTCANLKEAPNLSTPVIFENKEKISPWNKPTFEREFDEEGKELNVYSNDFEEFWSLYPKKLNKKGTFILWHRAKLWEKKDLIIERLKEQNQFDRCFLDGYAPHPRNYLQNQRWEDEIQKKIKSPSNNQPVYDKKSTDWVNKKIGIFL